MSKILSNVHKSAKRLHAAGHMDDVTMRGFDVEWQPIETAPSDGTFVLVWDGLGVCSAAYVWPMPKAEYEREICGRPISAKEYEKYAETERWGWVSYTAMGDTEFLEPSHWMPLPEGPK